MDELRELQKKFAGTLFSSSHTALEKNISPIENLQIYRNNIFINFREALKTVYPIVIKLVGEEFFDFSADTYIRSYPSTSGDLNNFGENFSVFLHSFPPVENLPYLPDIARLEWYCQQIYQAIEPPLFDVARLQSIPEEQQAELKFFLNPASQLLVSDFPLLKIWNLCQQENQDLEPSIDLSEGGVRLLLTRHNDTVIFNTLTAGEFSLLNTFTQQKNFSQACLQTLAVDKNFDLAACLQNFIANRIVVNFSF